MAIIVLLWPATVMADTSSSTNYRVEQTFFGSGGELDASSASYRARQTLGELGIGNTASANYQAFAGFNTTDEPYIEVVVVSANTDIGVLDSGAVTTTTGNFYVRAWQAHGYVVQTQSDPPTNTSNGYQLATPSTPTASAPGTEQFGINLVLNDEFCGVSCDLGVDPIQDPDGTFSFGQAANNYDIGGLFKYTKGDVVAESDESTSVTVYTVSYIFNIDDTTPSGRYVFSHNLVAVGTY